MADDEANKQTGTISELTSLYLARDSAVTHGVNVPTILAVGQYDKINCNTADGLPCDTAADIMTRESGNYSPTACLTPYVITASGHDTDLHISSSSYFNFVSGWITNYTVNYVGQKDANGCIP